MSRINVDPIFKQLLVEMLSLEGVEVETEVEVSRLPRTIDGIVTVKDRSVLPRIAAETPFSWFRTVNIIAFKGFNDPLTENDYHLILGRAYTAIAEKSVQAVNATFSIICGRKPRKEMTRLADDGVLEKLLDGVYEIGRGTPKIYLVVINELPLNEPQYDMLQLFTSSQERFKTFVKRLFADARFEIVDMAALVRPQWTTEVAMIAREHISKENYLAYRRWIVDSLLPEIPAEEVVETLTAERLLEIVSPRERVEGLSPEERVEGLSPEERVEGLSPEQLLQTLSAEEIQRMRELLEQKDSAEN